MPPEFLAEARRLAAQPIIKRAYRADDVLPQHRDTRAAALMNNRREWFTLSMSDSFQGRALADSLPLIAVVADATNDAGLRDYCLRQLEEMTSWHPLNRPGWGLYQSGPPVGANYNDGNWLGTGVSILAITGTLNALGDMVPANLRTALQNLLHKEIAGVRDDFKTRRPWYWNSPVSNQFVLPNNGVLLACLELGKGAGDADYEFAVTNLLRTLSAQGSDGAHHEGLFYGAAVNRELLVSARAAAKAGDNRLIEQAHLKNFGRWVMHMIQPGVPPFAPRVVNAFDGAERSLEMTADNPSVDSHHPLAKLRTPFGQIALDCLMLVTLATRDSQLAGFLRNYGQRPLTATAAEYELWPAREKPATAAPPTFATYSSSPLVVWRSGWKNDDSSIWVRGGSAGDSHDHADRGHVSWIVRGREVLIEAGSGDYATPDFQRVFSSGAAHNVLQISATEEEAARLGGMPRAGCDASIKVVRLDAAGGEIMVDATGAYPPKLLHKWTRRVRWSVAELLIDDMVQLMPGISAAILFRFHLSEEVTAEITGLDKNKCLKAAWASGKMEFCCNVPLQLTTATHPHALSYTKIANHTVLLASSLEKVPTLHLSTSLRVKDF